LRVRSFLCRLLVGCIGWLGARPQLPGRTDNEIKNYWNTRTKRRQRAGLPVYPPEVQLHLALSKRCHYDDYDFPPLASSPQLSATTTTTDVQALGAGPGYASSRPAPLDLARSQLAATTSQQTAQFLSPPPFSAPSSPWAKPFARNAQYFQLAHSSPVSPSTPTGPVHPAMPDLSLGGHGARAAAADQSKLPPLSPSPGPRVELPSNQYGQPAPPTSAAAVASGLALPDHQNAASLEQMLQELHDVIKVEPQALVPASGGGAALERHDCGGA
jgi:transcription factor MYB, plant